MGVEDKNTTHNTDDKRILVRFLKKDPPHPLPQKEADELWMRIQAGNKGQVRKRIFFQAAGIAASIAILLTIGWYTLHTRVPETDYLAILKENVTLVDSVNNVQLVLANNRKLSIDGEDTKLGYQEEGVVKVNSEKIDLASPAEEKTTEAFNQLIVPIGKRSTVTFADGTQIWVNSGTKVIYPVRFAADKREIFVDGEAFLEVSRDETKPFIVKTRKIDIKVLGTRFNVSAYENQADQQIVLVSGKVEVEIPGQSKNILAPNQMFSYNNNTNKSGISKVDVNDYIAWKDGYYQFRHQSLAFILEKVAKYYGRTIRWDDETGALSCSGKLDLKESLDEVLNTLRKAAPIEIIQQSDNIIISVKQ